MEKNTWAVLITKTSKFKRSRIVWEGLNTMAMMKKMESAERKEL